MVLPKSQNNRSAEEKCTWGLYGPICKKEEEDGTEDWKGDQQRNHHPQNLQQPQTYDVPDQYSEQISLRREWDEKMDHVNEKYNLNYYFSSKSDSDFEPEHKYETLI